MFSKQIKKVIAIPIVYLTYKQVPSNPRQLSKPYSPLSSQLIAANQCQQPSMTLLANDQEIWSYIAT